MNEALWFSRFAKDRFKSLSLFAVQLVLLVVAGGAFAQPKDLTDIFDEAGSIQLHELSLNLANRYLIELSEARPSGLQTTIHAARWAANLRSELLNVELTASGRTILDEWNAVARLSKPLLVAFERFEVRPAFHQRLELVAVLSKELNSTLEDPHFQRLAPQGKKRIRETFVRSMYDRLFGDDIGVSKSKSIRNPQSDRVSLFQFALLENHFSVALPASFPGTGDFPTFLASENPQLKSLFTARAENPRANSADRNGWSHLQKIAHAWLILQTADSLAIHMEQRTKQATIAEVFGDNFDPKSVLMDASNGPTRSFLEGQDQAGFKELTVREFQTMMQIFLYQKMVSFFWDHNTSDIWQHSEMPTATWGLMREFTKAMSKSLKHLPRKSGSQGPQPISGKAEILKRAREVVDLMEPAAAATSLRLALQMQHPRKLIILFHREKGDFTATDEITLEGWKIVMHEALTTNKLTNSALESVGYLKPIQLDPEDYFRVFKRTLEFDPRWESDFAKMLRNPAPKKGGKSLSKADPFEVFMKLIAMGKEDAALQAKITQFFAKRFPPEIPSPTENPLLEKSKRPMKSCFQLAP